MARIGLKRPVVSPITSETSSATVYGSGRVLAKAISANININNVGTDPLIADDESAETASGFSDGTIEVGVDDLTDVNTAFILGHTIVNIGGVDELQANTDDIGPYLGIGFTMTRMKAGVRTYPARIIKKVQFQEPSEETKTKGKEIEWQTPSLTGSILAPSDKNWKRQATFATEAEATAWVDGILHTTVVTKTALNAKIVVIEALTPATYTAATWGNMAVALYLAKIVAANADAAQISVDAATANLTDVQEDLVTV